MVKKKTEKTPVSKNARGPRGTQLFWARAGLHAVPYVFTFAFLAALAGSACAFAAQQDLFGLNHIRVLSAEVVVSDPYRLMGLARGESIWGIHLDRTEERIRKFHPEFAVVKVRRRLPDTLELELRRRVPVVDVWLDKFYALDESGIVLSESAEPDSRRPVIAGVPKPSSAVTTGSRIHFKALNSAIRLVLDASEFAVFRAHRLTRVDVSDPKNIILILEDKVEIKLGSRNFGDKLKRLAETVGSPDFSFDSEKIRYLDLRFGDPIVGFR